MDTNDVDNPATGAVIGGVPRFGAAETRQTIDTAARAFLSWRKEAAMSHAAILRRWFDLMMANQEDLALLITPEQGKTLSESRGEVLMRRRSWNSSAKKRSAYTAT